MSRAPARENCQATCLAEEVNSALVYRNDTGLHTSIAIFDKHLLKLAPHYYLVSCSRTPCLGTAQDSSPANEASSVLVLC